MTPPLRDPVPVLTQDGAAVAAAFPHVAFAITGVSRSATDGPLSGERRSVGLYTTLARAHAALQQNVGDLFDGGDVPHAVIEVIPMDTVFGIAAWRQWYAFDLTHAGYRLCPEPEAFASLACIGPFG
jgi:hypothetical protein